MQTVTLHITGMKCQHCVQNVAQALNALPGVSATVSLDSASATVQSDKAIDRGALIKAVAAAGYQAE